MKAPLVLLKMDVLIILYKTCDICFYLFALNKVGFLLQDYDVSELLRVNYLNARSTVNYMAYGFFK